MIWVLTVSVITVFNSYLNSKPQIGPGHFIQNLFPEMPPIVGYTPPNSNSLLDWSRQAGGLKQMAL